MNTCQVHPRHNTTKTPADEPITNATPASVKRKTAVMLSLQKTHVSDLPLELSHLLQIMGQS